MNAFKKILSVLLVAVMLVSVLAGCNGDDTDSTQPTGNGVAGTYTVTVKTAGGLPMSELDIYVYADESMTDLKQFGKTDANGTVSFALDGKDPYAISVTGAPKGYLVDKTYSFNGTSANISLKSEVVKDESLAGANLGLGDVAYDFSVTTPDGQTVTLSEELKTKEVVVLNFWYNGCSACEYEFPYMEEAYQTYKDKVSIIAVDPLYDSNSTKGYQESRGLTFTMASVPNNWTTGFNVNGANVDGYPTTVMIDRYGVICMIEEGALTALRYWTSLFEHFTGDDYEQKLVLSADDVLTRQKPNVEMPSAEEVAGVMNGDDIQVTYSGDDGEYSWPFVIGEKLGEKCLKASNSQVDESYAILVAEVTLEAGQAFGFDYLISSELGSDVLHVIVNDEPINVISGYNEEERWDTCYPWVASEAGTYKLVLSYIKDAETSVADDTVYIKNLHISDAGAIKTPTYLPRQAATSADGFEYSYVDVVLNEKDGYYHVGDKNGPLLLAVLMNPSQFSEEETIWDICYDGAAKEYYEEMVEFFSYASNSKKDGVCTVNEKLAELLKKVADIAGFEDDENEWLKMCMYYQAYGTNGKQLEDPIQGLACFNALEAKEGKNVPTNVFNYQLDKILMPRGYIAKFTPSRSGVYRITSRSESEVEGWIFTENREEVFTYWQNERNWEDGDNVSMLYYMEAGKNYYIDIAFWDYYAKGTIPFDIVYMGATYNVLQLCSPGFFTYDTNATGDAMYDVIAGGIDVVLGPDGYYYHDLGDGNRGSKIYADFIGLTSVFGSPIATVGDVIGLVDKGAFDFSKTEDDNRILAYLEQNDGDVKKTEEQLRKEWGEEFDQYAEQYQIEDVFEGIYHGKGEDYSDEIRAYAKKMAASGDLKGCVAVDERLGELLQMLMDKFTFEDVENSWIKVCYYYNNIGK